MNTPGIEKSLLYDSDEFILPPRKSRFQEFWLQFKANTLAFIGMIIFVVFF